MGSRLVGYEPSTKFQNLRCEKISSLRLKSAKLKKKTYYHAFLRKILAFNLKIIIISEHVCEFRPVTICQRNVNRGKHRHYFNHICKYLWLLYTLYICTVFINKDKKKVTLWIIICEMTVSPITFPIHWLKNEPSAKLNRTGAHVICKRCYQQ